MEFRLLGPVEVWEEGVAIDAGAPRQRTVLAALAVEAGRVVPTDVLIDRVWGETPPQRVREALYVYATHIRAMLHRSGNGRPGLISRSQGYLLDVEPELVDLHRFRSLTERARVAHLPDGQRVTLLKQALDLWRGQPLAGVAGQWASSVRHNWRQQHLDTLVTWARGELVLGNAGRVIAPLTEAVSEHPLAESPVAVVMLAYQGLGRSAEALDQYTAIRKRLAEELGTDPMPELQQIHQAVLRGQPVHTGAVTAPARPERRRPIAAQLPADVGGFIGRDTEFVVLDGALLHQPRNRSTSMPVRVVTGTPGIGKTALVVRWAHRSADSFPDGQLFVDLCGFDSVRPPLEPIDVLRRFLRALGVDALAIPGELEEAAALFRSQLAGRRILLVLDNAHSYEQVRPLLPGSGGCMVLVTSRTELRGLITRDGATLLRLDPLTPQQAHSLLREALADRDGLGGDDAAAELARHCSYLPLALRVAASHLACHPHLTVEKYVAQMLASPMSLLDTRNDVDAQVIGAFEVSYLALTPSAQRLFRFIGLVPGSDFATPAAAALLGVTTDDAQRAIDHLCTAHLIHEHHSGRYTLHDLLRSYARGRCALDESPETVEEATRRLADFYARTAYDAYPLMGPRRTDTDRDLKYPPVEPLIFADRSSAFEWFDQERENVLGVMALAGEKAWHDLTWNLANDLFTYFIIRRRWPEWLTVLRLGLHSAEQLSDPQAKAHMENAFGVVYKQTGDYAAARAHYGRAVEFAIEAGNTRMAAVFNINLGGLCVNIGEPEAAVRHLRFALAHPEAEAQFAVPAYVNLGCAFIDLNEISAAAEALDHALELALSFDDVVNACHSHHNLAEIALRRGDRATAQHHAEEQLRLAQEIGDPLRTAAALDMLASSLAPEDLPRAREHWRAAHATYDQLKHRAADVIESWLATLETLRSPAELDRADDTRRRLIRRLV